MFGNFTRQSDTLSKCVEGGTFALYIVTGIHKFDNRTICCLIRQTPNNLWIIYKWGKAVLTYSFDYNILHLDVEYLPHTVTGNLVEINFTWFNSCVVIPTQRHIIVYVHAARSEIVLPIVNFRVSHHPNTGS